MDFPARQESRKKTNRLSTGTSLPSLNVPVISPSDFLKSFHRINAFVSRGQRAAQMEHLKRARIQSIEDHQFVKAIKHLENAATQPRFVSEYTPLQPWKAIIGFLEEGTNQYFTMNLKDNLSPLNVVIQRSKGSVESFFSFKSLRPGPDIYDRRFKSSSFRIEGRFTRFREPSACLCVRAISDCTFAIMITFGEGPPAIDDEDPKLPVATMSQTQPTSFLVGSLEELFSNISTAPSISSVDSVKLNRSVCVMPKNYEVVDEHRKEVKMRKEENEVLKKDRVREQAERNQRREDARTQSKYISSILERKARFEQIWLGLIFFARATYEAHRRFVIDKTQSIFDTKKFLICFRLQKNYRRLHPVSREYTLKHRQKTYGRNHLRLLTMLSCFHMGRLIHDKLMDAMRQSRLINAPGRCTEKFYYRMSLIQQEWRQSKLMEKHFLLHLSHSWDFVLSQIIRKQEESRKKKRAKKKQSKRRYSIVSEPSKMRVIKEMMQAAIEKCREVNTKPEAKFKLTRLSSLLPRTEELKTTVKAFSRSEKQDNL